MNKNEKNQSGYGFSFKDYIRILENPDKIGLNNGVWSAPIQKGYDKNQRGYGIDINTNKKAKALTNNRPGRWLTEKEADTLMDDHINYITEAANKHIKGFSELPFRRRWALLGMLYRGDSVNKSGININEPNDQKFFKSVSDYYRSKGLNTRANSSDEFFNRPISKLLSMFKFKQGGQVRKMQTAAGGPIHYSRTMDANNLSKAANYVGEYVLKGLGAFGKFLNAGFTSPTYGTVGQVSYARNAKDAKRQRKQSEASEQAMGKAMTWISPLNYGAALWNGHGLDARKGEEEVASWSPAWQAVGRLGELYVGPKAVKGVKSAPKVIVNTAAKAGVKPAKAAVVAREIKQGIKQNTKNGRIEVTGNYFNSPDKWYRITETPEKYGIMEQGKNVTTYDASQTYGTINGWRSSMLKAPITKSSEGFIKRPYKIELGIRRKNGQAHGNTSQAAKGKLWGGTTSGSNLFPEGIIEGQAPSMINYGIDRTNFVITPWEQIPNGGRVGFHTGEMPMSNLGWFQKTKNGTYTYEPIIPEKRITYHTILQQEPSTSLKFFERPTLSDAQQLAGATKWERNFKPKWHVANYPGYQLKGLMKGSQLEKQLSKNGTISINQLNAYFNKASQLEREVANKVLAEKFAGQKTIDYNQFKKAVQDELVTYNRNYNAQSMIPTMTTEKMMAYGGDRLGIIKDFKDIPDGTGGLVTTWTEELPVLFKQFTFETPKISIGNRKHYSGQPIGHTRTFTNQQEPQILHVMESQSDWAQKSLGLTKAEKTAIQNIDEQLKTGTPTGFSTLEELQVQKQAILDRASQRTQGISYQSQHLHDNYLQRQLQENLRYAAENGQTKMRYPTSETAAKIEGYQKVNHTQLNELSNQQMKLGEQFENGEISWEEYDKIIDAINKQKRELFGKEYDPKHQTILKKYSDFPKLFQKLFKDQKVRTVTDAKGNTWYEVDVPKGYLSREWQFKQGGKMNILEFLKNGSGIHIKPENRGKFTKYCHGKVTSECIARGKRSSDPAVRKRATFADNARHFKHKEGGKAFVSGVNVLDSNPKAYKYVKKKYKMAQQGTKLNLFQKVGNFLNSDLGKTVGTGLVNAFSSWASSNKQNNAIDSQIEGLKKQNKADINSIQNWALQKATEEITQKFNEQQQLFNSGASFEQPSPIVFEHLKSQLANKYAQQAINDANLNSQEAIANLESQKTNPTSDIFSSLANVGIDYLSNKFANKALSKNGVPSSRNASFYSNPYLKTQNKVGTINSNGSMNTGIGGTTYNWKTNTFGSNNMMNSFDKIKF